MIGSLEALLYTTDHDLAQSGSDEHIVLDSLQNEEHTTSEEPTNGMPTSPLGSGADLPQLHYVSPTDDLTDDWDLDLSDFGEQESNLWENRERTTREESTNAMSTVPLGSGGDSSRSYNSQPNSYTNNQRLVLNAIGEFEFVSNDRLHTTDNSGAFPPASTTGADSNVINHPPAVNSVEETEAGTLDSQAADSDGWEYADIPSQFTHNKRTEETTDHADLVQAIKDITEPADSSKHMFLTHGGRNSLCDALRKHMKEKYGLNRPLQSGLVNSIMKGIFERVSKQINTCKICSKPCGKRNCGKHYKRALALKRNRVMAVHGIAPRK